MISGMSEYIRKYPDKISLIGLPVYPDPIFIKNAVTVQIFTAFCNLNDTLSFLQRNIPVFFQRI